MKKLLTIASAVVITLLNTTAIADNHSEKTVKQQPNMMMLMARTSPMPVLMPIMVKNSEKLGLSQQQNDELTKWRTENLAPALTLAKQIIDGDKAIKQAALDNKPKADIEIMIKTVLEKRLELAIKMLLCRENTKRILTEGQWEQVVTLYREKHVAHAHPQ